jgi:DNA-binding response OmpR family regulator
MYNEAASNLPLKDAGAFHGGRPSCAPHRGYLKMSKEILVIEDEGFIAGLLGRNLARRGYTLAVLDCKQAMRQTRKHRPSLVLLEAPANPGQALEICKHVRDTLAAPIIVLAEPAACVEELEAVECLTKPVDFRALLLAVENALKRQRGTKLRALRVLRRGELALDLKTRLLAKGDQRYRLTPKEFLLLKLFMTKPGQVLTHKTILREVWNTDYDGDIRTLHVHVSWLRQKIEDTPSEPARLRTVRGVGYRFDVKP